MLEEKRGAAAMVGGTYRFFLRGKSSTAVEDDFKVLAGSKAKLRPYDGFLKKFQYQAALDAALEVLPRVIVPCCPPPHPPVPRFHGSNQTCADCCALCFCCSDPGRGADHQLD